jgi:ferric-dicitrate binding protein FerR (iron transport regulator)
MENKDDFLKDWLEGKISPEEINAKKENGDAFVEEFEELITKSSHLKVPASMTKEEAWKKLSGRLTETLKPEAKEVRLNRWIPMSIAASLSLIAVAAFFMLDRTTVSSQLAEVKTHVLPDGSTVTLNAGSSLEFPTYRWSGNRTVILEGEAFFQVTKGSTFTVKNEQATVTVLGTSFNVKARPSGYEVSCFTGKVRVASAGNNVILTKGLFTRLETGMLTPAETFHAEKTTWREGDFYFEGKPLHEVIDELERQFNIEIVFTGDGNRLYTGFFTNKNLGQALEMVFKPMSLRYSQENNKIIVQ